MARKAKRKPNLKTAAKPASTKLVVDGFEFHVFVQLNDVYFLDSRPDYSKPGGLILPRVATMVHRLREHLPGQVTFCVPGDFLAPSCLGKLTAGEHMVDIFNSIDVDFVTFGNHEFEQPPLTAATLAKNITQSDFTWLCANFSPSDDALAALKQRAEKLKPFDTIQLRDGLVAVLFGVTLEDRYRGYGVATDPIEATKAVLQRTREEISAVRDGTAEPVFIALTHQDAADDVRLARQCPELLLMMGGHDHDEEYVIDESRPLIVKATSNARTIRFNVLLHRRCGTVDNQSPVDRETLWSTVRSRILNRVFNTLTQEAAAAAPAAVRELLGPPVGPNIATGRSREAFIDDTRLRSGIVTIGDYEVGVFSFAISTLAPAVEKGIPEAQVTLSRINHWEQHWDRTASATRTPIVTLPIEFDARDAHVRKRSTNIGNLAADALRFDVQGRQLAPIGILNSGSLRADRVFAKREPISQRTICDLLFFDNTVFVYTLSGRKLWEILQKSLELRTHGGAEGHGDFLQLSGLKVIWRGSDVTRVIKTDHADTEEDLLADDTTYDIATTDYVGKVSKHYLGFFKDAPERRIAPYNQQFDAAIRRLPVIRRPEDAHTYYLIHNSRWLPADRVQ
jgi:2',3'-cyclic-nucleotide 2'-phosphodiesterase (5'-nucleotidase family)